MKVLFTEGYVKVREWIIFLELTTFTNKNLFEEKLSYDFRYLSSKRHFLFLVNSD